MGRGTSFDFPVDRWRKSEYIDEAMNSDYTDILCRKHHYGNHHLQYLERTNLLASPCTLAVENQSLQPIFGHFRPPAGRTRMQRLGKGFGISPGLPQILLHFRYLGGAGLRQVDNLWFHLSVIANIGSLYFTPPDSTREVSSLIWVGIFRMTIRNSSAVQRVGSQVRPGRMDRNFESGVYRPRRI